MDDDAVTDIATTLRCIDSTLDDMSRSIPSDRADLLRTSTAIYCACIQSVGPPDDHDDAMRGGMIRLCVDGAKALIDAVDSTLDAEQDARLKALQAVAAPR